MLAPVEGDLAGFPRTAKINWWEGKDEVEAKSSGINLGSVWQKKTVSLW